MMRLGLPAALLASALGLGGCIAMWAAGTAVETAGNVAVGAVKAAGSVAGAAADLALPDDEAEKESH